MNTKVIAEYFVLKDLLEQYPTGVFSYVSDSYDYFKVLTKVLPALKDQIMVRQPDELGLAKLVVRPDSGDPVKIICGEQVSVYKNLDEAIKEVNKQHFMEASEDCEGSYNCGSDSYTSLVKVGDKYYNLTTPFEYNRHDKQYYFIDNYEEGMGDTVAEEVQPTPEQKGTAELLWETFGGTINEAGYKVLDSHIGMIYGDSITLERARAILEGLKTKGFASCNIVFGIGSFTYQFITRDTFGFGYKTTFATVNGKDFQIQKDPATDAGVKKSAKGLLRVEKEGDNFVLYDQQSREQEEQGELKVVFKNGDLKVETTWDEVRSRLKT